MGSRGQVARRQRRRLASTAYRVGLCLATNVPPSGSQHRGTAQPKKTTCSQQQHTGGNPTRLWGSAYQRSRRHHPPAAAPQPPPPPPAAPASTAAPAALPRPQLLPRLPRLPGRPRLRGPPPQPQAPARLAAHLQASQTWKRPLLSSQMSKGCCNCSLAAVHWHHHNTTISHHTRTGSKPTRPKACLRSRGAPAASRVTKKRKRTQQI